LKNELPNIIGEAAALLFGFFPGCVNQGLGHAYPGGSYRLIFGGAHLLAESLQEFASNVNKKIANFFRRA